MVHIGSALGGRQISFRLLAVAAELRFLMQLLLLEPGKLLSVDFAHL